MSTKYHPKYRHALDRKGFPIRVKIAMMDCPACKPRCGYCRWPFTLSTALGQLEELIFCSEGCAKAGLMFDPPPTTHQPRRAE
jgi:hypothetical protein